MKKTRYMILDRDEVLWSDDSYDAFETGSAIMAAAVAGEEKGYKDAIGDSWIGDLVFIQEISRTR